MEEKEWVSQQENMRTLANKTVFKDGVKDGIPIGIGYFAVAFSLGITVRNAGMSAFQGFLMSLLNNASAGQYAALVVIAAKSSYLELALVTLITNARYLLMGCALSQRLSPQMPFSHRFFLSFDITDELFGLMIARSGYLNPYYMYGAVTAAAPCWAIGTAIGVVSGNILPLLLVSALSVALYGMFLAVIIPPTRTNKVLGALVLGSFAASYVTAKAPIIANISSGSRTIILTVILCTLAAILFPINKEGERHA
ncbi:AzlC family ABC transporter permease [Enterococcus sp. AZ072]|uniref:AzlC family ABC transporter permease n=1 Tax=unclassified Enterococcus TaxID=2608891 RepID=UPI003D2C9623